MHKIWIRKNGKTPFLNDVYLEQTKQYKFEEKNAHKCL